MNISYSDKKRSKKREAVKWKVKIENITRTSEQQEAIYDLLYKLVYNDSGDCETHERHLC